ncbi:hypothetical protein TNCV_2100211 [Trichonephila clavipes]|nr:hypothetical protein TNCV_2100211 [Trichonephila clavipes]
MLRTPNYRDQIKSLYEKFPNLNCKSCKEFIKLFTNDFKEYRSLTHAFTENKDYEYYVIELKLNKPIKVEIKGLPIFTNTEEIRSDLEELGYVVESFRQMISKKNKTPPLFLSSNCTSK